MQDDTPKKIKFHRQSQVLELEFSDGVYQLRAEYLRVYSPSAEVKGHGPGQEVLQLDKEDVGITKIEPQGNYAVKLIFSDLHDSGIYTWAYLKSLAENYENNWQNYLAKVKEFKSQEGVSTVKWVSP